MLGNSTAYAIYSDNKIHIVVIKQLWKSGIWLIIILLHTSSVAVAAGRPPMRKRLCHIAVIRYCNESPADKGFYLYSTLVVHLKISLK